MFDYHVPRRNYNYKDRAARSNQLGNSAGSGAAPHYRNRPITWLGLDEGGIEPYGRYKAKVPLQVLERLKNRGNGKLIAVTAISPTPLGEGKTVTSIGLGEALAKIGVSVCNTCRQPSLGPTFRTKGGAAGGKYAQVVPMEDFNMHLTGDFHAVTSAHNRCAAMIEPASSMATLCAWTHRTSFGAAL